MQVIKFNPENWKDAEETMRLYAAEKGERRLVIYEEDFAVKETHSKNGLPDEFDVYHSDRLVVKCFEIEDGLFCAYPADSTSTEYSRDDTDPYKAIGKVICNIF